MKWHISLIWSKKHKELSQDASKSRELHSLPYSTVSTNKTQSKVYITFRLATILDHTDCSSPIAADSQEPTVCLSFLIFQCKFIWIVNYQIILEVTNNFGFGVVLTFFITATWLTFVIFHNQGCHLFSSLTAKGPHHPMSSSQEGYVNILVRWMPFVGNCPDHNILKLKPLHKPNNHGYCLQGAF
jgi:hypothetical protein